MRFGRAGHTKGWGSALVSARKRSMAASSSKTEQNTPRLRRRFVSLAKKPSTALSHEVLAVASSGDIRLSHPLAISQNAVEAVGKLEPKAVIPADVVRQEDCAGERH